MEHTSLQTLRPRTGPRRELDHLEQIWTTSQTEEWEPACGPFVPVKVPEGGGAALEILDADHNVTWPPLRDANQSHRGGKAAGVRRDAMKHRLPRPHGHSSLPDHSRLLSHSHPAEVTEGLEAHLLQSLLFWKPEQDGDKARYHTSA